MASPGDGGQPEGRQRRGDLIRYVAVIVGVILAWVYNIDITRDVLGLTPQPAALGVVLGRGASYVHNFY